MSGGKNSYGRGWFSTSAPAREKGDDKTVKPKEAFLLPEYDARLIYSDEIKKAASKYYGDSSPEVSSDEDVRFSEQMSSSPSLAKNRIAPENFKPGSHESTYIASSPISNYLNFEKKKTDERQEGDKLVGSPTHKRGLPIPTTNKSTSNVRDGRY